MTRLSSFFKVVKGTKELSFGNRRLCTFNYLDFDNLQRSDPLVCKAILRKQMNDSYRMDVETPGDYFGNLRELKLTNQGILTWEDYWIDASSGTLVDPKLEGINLQKNNLIHANFNMKRPELRSLNLEGNPGLQALFLRDVPKLEYLNVSNCPALNVINMGFNGSLKTLLVRNCNLSSSAQEQLLGGFTPKVTSTSNVKDSALFRKRYETLLDMRGNTIDWSNSRIASKIRLLLCNNWMVLWDNVPPTSIVPPQMYGFFTASLEESLIKDYYG